jgi:hypothetical protein
MLGLRAPYGTEGLFLSAFVEEGDKEVWISKSKWKYFSGAQLK